MKPQAAVLVLLTFLVSDSCALLSSRRFALALASARHATMNAAAAAAAAVDGACNKMKLYDIPVSNNGARVRMVVYYKGIESHLDIISPTELGGLKAPEYLRKNPQGKMPLLLTESEVPIPESDTISRYLMDKFVAVGPGLGGDTLEIRALVNLISRHHDLYLGAIQGALYRASPPFGVFGSRSAALEELRKQLAVLENLAVDSGPYLTGSAPTLADCTVFPTAIFLEYMLPKFGWKEEEIFGTKLRAWFNHMCFEDAVGQKVLAEVQGGLDKWDRDGRWDAVHLAGRRDVAPRTVFDKILSGEIPSIKVYEDDVCFAFKDTSPVAPTHVLVIPKQREGLTQLRHSSEDHKFILGHLLWAAGEIGRTLQLDGFRVVINDGEQAAQSVFHLHVHVIGGREMTWPPG